MGESIVRCYFNEVCLFRWWRVLNEGGSSGWIPSNYVDETSVPPNRQALPSAPTNGSYQYNNGTPNFSSQPIGYSAASAASGRVLEVGTILK